MKLWNSSVSLPLVKLASTFSHFFCLFRLISEVFPPPVKGSFVFGVLKLWSIGLEMPNLACLPHVAVFWWVGRSQTLIVSLSPPSSLALLDGPPSCLTLAYSDLPGNAVFGGRLLAVIAGCLLRGSAGCEWVTTEGQSTFLDDITSWGKYTAAVFRQFFVAKVLQEFNNVFPFFDAIFWKFPEILHHSLQNRQNSERFREKI